MSGESLSEDELLTLFEAARWAPSTFDEQEWYFLYARRGTADWDTFFELLEPANRVWCHRAGVLVVALAHKVFVKSGKPNPVHAFDCGAAWENLALQATVMGLVAHGIMGFDGDKARVVLKVPDDYAVLAMIALGRPGDPGDLPPELRMRERPSDRRPVQESICEGEFNF